MSKKVYKKGPWILELDEHTERDEAVDSCLIWTVNGKERAWGSLGSAEHGEICGADDQPKQVPWRIVDWAVDLEDRFHENKG